MSCPRSKIDTLDFSQSIRLPHSIKITSHYSPFPARRGGSHKEEDGTDNNETNRNPSEATNRPGRWESRRRLWSNGVHKHDGGCGEAGDEYDRGGLSRAFKI